MKTLVVVTLVFVFNLSNAFSFSITEKDPQLILQKATQTYNKNLKGDLWKAELLGNTVYFKKNKDMFKIEIIEIKNVATIIAKVNGKQVTIKDGDKANNILQLKSALFVRDTSIWNLIIPQAHAEDMPYSFKIQLESTLGLFESVFASVGEDGEKDMERFCTLSELEESGKSKYNHSSNRQAFAEVKYLVQMQEKYVMPLMNRDSEYARVSSTRIEKGERFRKCLYKLADTRRKAINAHYEGFACFETTIAGRQYINPEILKQNLQNREGNCVDNSTASRSGTTNTPKLKNGGSK